MRILVTGGTGFVGRWAVSALVDAGHDVFVVSRGLNNNFKCKIIVGDLCNTEAIDAALETAQPDILLHLAWFVEHGKFWNAIENLDWVIATIRLISASQKFGVRRIVCAGTCMEYDLSLEDSCKEFTTTIKPNSLYATSKDSVRRVIEQFAISSEFEYAWGRLFFLFGPDENPNRLVPSVALSLLSGQAALISSGTQVRDFMDVREAGRAFAALAVSSVTGPVNIATGQALQIKQLAEEVRIIVGGDGEIRLGALPDRVGEPTRVVADITRLRDEVGFSSIKTIRESLVETIEWLRGHYAK